MEPKSYTDGVASKQELVDESLIHERYYFRTRVVSRGKCTTLQQLDSASTYEIGTDEIVEGQVILVKRSAADVRSASHHGGVKREWDR